MTDRNREIEKALKPFESDGLKGAAEEARLGQTRMRNALLKKILPTPTPDCREANGLLPCPFCGKPGSIDEERSKGNPDHVVFVPSCSDSDCLGVLIQSFARRSDAITAWNRRPAAGGGEPASRPSPEEIRAKFEHDQNWPIQSFDAQDWAKAFCKKFHEYNRPDEGTMLAWFASALMRGYDEHSWRYPENAASTQAPAPVPALTAEDRKDIAFCRSMIAERQAKNAADLGPCAVEWVRRLLAIIDRLRGAA